MIGHDHHHHHDGDDRCGQPTPKRKKNQATGVVCVCMCGDDNNIGRFGDTYQQWFIWLNIQFFGIFWENEKSTTIFLFVWYRKIIIILVAPFFESTKKNNKNKSNNYIPCLFPYQNHSNHCRWMHWPMD